MNRSPGMGKTVEMFIHVLFVFGKSVMFRAKAVTIMVGMEGTTNNMITIILHTKKWLS
jgi:hypothetical protein